MVIWPKLAKVETEERDFVHVSLVIASEGAAGCGTIRIACTFFSYAKKCGNLSKKKFLINSSAEALILFNEKHQAL